MQKEIFDKIDTEEVYPTHAQSIRMKKLDERGNLSTGTINQILLESKPNQRERIVLQADKFENLFHRNLPISERENYMAAAMEHYARFLKRKDRKYER